MVQESIKLRKGVGLDTMSNGQKHIVEHNVQKEARKIKRRNKTGKMNPTTFEISTVSW